MITIYIYLDAETLPPNYNDEQLSEFKKNLSAPGTYKDPAKIEKWKEDNWEQKFRDLAKKSNTANVATLAYGFDDEEIGCAYSEDRDEISVLKAFYEDLRDYIDEKLVDASVDEVNYNIKWVGYNIRKFDMDLLWKRAIYYGFYELSKIIPRDRFSKDIIDIMEIWQGSNTMDMIKQDYVCKYLGIEGKPDDIDGSKVYDFWMDGKYDKIAEYNIDDVKKVKEMYKKIFNK